MTIKTTTLPAAMTLVFDNDPETYTCQLTAIENIDTENDTCVLVCDDLMPQTCRLKAPYSMLDTSAMHFESGVHLFLDENEALDFVRSFE